jgi:hypothetical protein
MRQSCREQAGEWAGEQASGQASGQASRREGRRAGERVGEQASGQASGQASRREGRRAGEWVGEVRFWAEAAKCRLERAHLMGQTHWTLIIADCSSVGRPFDVDPAGFHLEQLRCCGMTFLRFLVTWGAIEERQQGVYDLDYSKHVRKLVRAGSDLSISDYSNAHFVRILACHGSIGSPREHWSIEAE